MSKISEKECETISGIKCVFPFKYIGVTYEECTTTGNYGIMWCATEVETNGDYARYGNCGPNCGKY